MSRTIAVIFGGVSNENEVSVITGTMAANLLKKGGDRVVPVYIAQSGRMFTGDELCDIAVFKDFGEKKARRALIGNGGVYVLGRRGKTRDFIRVDAALNCCHGGLGEGGGISGLCLASGIPLAGAGIFESAAFIDKYLTKTVLRGLGVSCLPFAYLRDSNTEECEKMGFPLIVKPANLGSSIGVEKADNVGELKQALLCAFELDSAAIVEPYIADRREINCAAYFSDGKVHVSECEEAITDGELLSFEDKYKGGGKRVCPADIPESTADLIKRTTEEVYARLNMRGIIRFDFILSGNEAYISEVNTVPGSLSYYLLSDGFKNFYGVLDAVIEQARSDFAAASGKKLINCGLLKNIPAQSVKSGVKGW